jgi:hypothetical protein
MKQVEKPDGSSSVSSLIRFDIPGSVRVIRMISPEQKKRYAETPPPLTDERSPCTVHDRLDKFIANQMKGWDMKPLSTVLLLMAVLIAAVLVAVFIIIGFSYINLDNGGTPPQTITISTTSIPTLRTVYTTIPTQSTQDPIIGPWLNGMVFYANGTVGSEGITSWQSWQVNTNENNSYFILSDVGGTNSRVVASTEWLYNPASDKINKRGSLESFARGIPKPTPTPITTVTTIQTQQTQVVTTTTPPAPFSYNDCTSACKIIFSVDRNNGAYNDCLNTCNIENLNSQS